MRSLRIFHFIEGGDTSGFFPQLARWHDRDRYKIEFGTLYESDPDLRDELSTIGVWTWNGGAKSRWDFPAVARRLRRHLAESADIVHTHLFEPSLVGLGVARTLGLPTVSTRHHSNYHARMGKHIHVRLDRLATRWSDAVIAVSEHTARVLVDDERADASRVHTIPNGIDTARIQVSDAGTLRALRQALKRGDDAVRLILHPARFHPEKGHLDLFEAIRLLATDTELQVRLLLAGTGPARQMYEQAVRDLGVEDRVDFLGFRADIYDLMSTADVVVFPSLAEAFGLALLEAIYIGSPVIATEVGGMPEIIRTVGAGTLVPPNRPRSLAEAIAKMLASGPEQRGSRAVRERVRATYSFRRLMSEYEAVYDATLADWGET